jgi:hypothetical protein
VWKFASTSIPINQTPKNASRGKNVFNITTPRQNFNPQPHQRQQPNTQATSKVSQYYNHSHDHSKAKLFGFERA